MKITLDACYPSLSNKLQIWWKNNFNGTNLGRKTPLDTLDSFPTIFNGTGEAVPLIVKRAFGHLNCLHSRVIPISIKPFHD